MEARDNFCESVFSFYRLSFHQVFLGLNESGQVCITSAFPPAEIPCWSEIINL